MVMLFDLINKGCNIRVVDTMCQSHPYQQTNHTAPYVDSVNSETTVDYGIKPNGQGAKWIVISFQTENKKPMCKESDVGTIRTIQSLVFLFPNGSWSYSIKHTVGEVTASDFTDDL